MQLHNVFFRYMAALKIQYFYRNRLYLKRMIEEEKKRRLHTLKKGEILSNMFKYIIRYQYRKLKLSMLLKNLGKPCLILIYFELLIVLSNCRYYLVILQTNLITVDKMLAHRRKNLVLSSTLKIQYHVRRWIKRIRRHNVAKVVKLKQGKKFKHKSMKRKLTKAKSKRFKIVNRGGKVMRINILEEQRQKEEQRRIFDGLAHHQNSHVSDLNGSIALLNFKLQIPLSSNDSHGLKTPQTVKNVRKVDISYEGALSPSQG